MVAPFPDYTTNEIIYIARRLRFFGCRFDLSAQSVSGLTSPLFLWREVVSFMHGGLWSCRFPRHTMYLFRNLLSGVLTCVVASAG